MVEGFWGAKAMERRVLQCCADNPDCPFHEQCYQQYVEFVDRTEKPDRTQQASYRRSIETKLRNYHLQRRAGVPSGEAARHMTDKQTRLVLAQAISSIVRFWLVRRKEK
jgi:hypothetical protein